MKKIFLIASVMMLSVIAFAQRKVGTLSFQPKASQPIIRTPMALFICKARDFLALRIFLIEQ